jgi:hypothetical protein
MLGEGDEDRSTEQEITPPHLITESIQAELRRCFNLVPFVARVNTFALAQWKRLQPSLLGRRPSQDLCDTSRQCDTRIGF